MPPTKKVCWNPWLQERDEAELLPFRSEFFINYLKNWTTLCIVYIRCENLDDENKGGTHVILSTNTQAVQAAGGMSGVILLVYLIGIVAFFYFVLIRPQRKEQKRMDALLASMAVGDSVMTTSGFYGVIIDIDEEDQTVVVEFGSNKNCRIIMNKTAIAQIEKAK